MPGPEPQGGSITALRKADQSSGIPELRAAERRCNHRQTAEQWTWADRGPGVGAQDSRRAPKLERGRLGGGRCPEKGYPFVTWPCLTLATPRTVAHQAPLSTSFPRQEDWSGSYHFLLQIKVGGKVYGWMCRQVTWTRCRTRIRERDPASPSRLLRADSAGCFQRGGRRHYLGGRRGEKS